MPSLFMRARRQILPGGSREQHACALFTHLFVKKGRKKSKIFYTYLTLGQRMLILCGIWGMGGAVAPNFAPNKACKRRIFLY